jgi:hypothetical protein
MSDKEIIDTLALARVTIWAHTLKQTVVMTRLEEAMRSFGVEPEYLDPDGVASEATRTVAT